MDLPECQERRRPFFGRRGEGVQILKVSKPQTERDRDRHTHRDRDRHTDTNRHRQTHTDTDLKQNVRASMWCKTTNWPLVAHK